MRINLKQYLEQQPKVKWLWASLTVTLTLLFSYQNCSNGFKAKRTGDSGSAQSLEAETGFAIKASSHQGRAILDLDDVTLTVTGDPNNIFTYNWYRLVTNETTPETLATNTSNSFTITRIRDRHSGIYWAERETQGVVRKSRSLNLVVNAGPASDREYPENILSLIQDLLNNPVAWSNTLLDSANTSLACILEGSVCSAGENQLEHLVDEQGHVIFDSSNPAAGFDLTAAPCTEYSTTGNNNCPFRPSINWIAECSDGADSCVNPNIKFNISLAYHPENNPLRIEISDFTREVIKSNTQGYALSQYMSITMLREDESVVFQNPAPSTPAKNYNLAPGTNLKLRLVLTGSAAPFLVDWYFEGSSMGITTQDLEINNLNVTQAGNYYARIRSSLISSFNYATPIVKITICSEGYTYNNGLCEKTVLITNGSYLEQINMNTNEVTKTYSCINGYSLVAGTSCSITIRDCTGGNAVSNASSCKETVNTTSGLYSRSSYSCSAGYDAYNGACLIHQRPCTGSNITVNSTSCTETHSGSGVYARTSVSCASGSALPYANQNICLPASYVSDRKECSTVYCGGTNGGTTAGTYSSAAYYKITSITSASSGYSVSAGGIGNYYVTAKEGDNCSAGYFQVTCSLVTTPPPTPPTPAVNGVCPEGKTPVTNSNITICI